MCPCARCASWASPCENTRIESAPCWAAFAPRLWPNPLVRAFVVTEPGSTSLREQAEPTAASDEVLVRPLLVGMCATDLELMDGTIDPAYVKYPVVLGHEWVGVLDS